MRRPLEVVRPVIDPALSLRLTRLVADWTGAGYCQGNFNSYNCSAGHYTLNFGAIGFCERFEPRFQP